MSLTIKRNAIWMLLGNAAFAASQWFSVVILAHMGGAEEVGKFSLALAITTPIIMFFNLSLRSVLITDANDDYGIHKYLELRNITSFFGLIAIALVCLFSTQSTEQITIIFLIGIAKIFESNSDIYYGINQKRHRLDYIAKSMIARGIIGFLCLAVIYIFTRNLLYSVLLYTISWGVVYVFYDRKIINQYLKSLDEKNLKNGEKKKLFILSLPLGLVALVISLNTNIPRYFVEHYLGKEALGVFSALVWLVTIGNMFINSIGQSISAHLAKAYSSGDFKKFMEYSVKSVVMAFIIGVVGLLLSYLIGKNVLTILYGKNFAQYDTLLIMISFAAMFSYITVIMGHIITAMRKFRIFLPIYLVVTVIITISCILIIPKYGLFGSTIAFLSLSIADVLARFFLFWFIHKTTKQKT